MGKRVEYFRGSNLVDSLMNGQFKHAELADTTREDAVALAGQMLKAELFHRSELVPKPEKKSKRKRDPLDVEPEQLVVSRSKTFEDSETALYSWILEASRTRLYIQSMLLIAFGIFCTLIKVWPLWLKIFVWYAASSASVLRLLLAKFFRAGK